MAIMFTMSVYHPDIINFITAKEEEGVIANANMSVMVDDKFMKAVEDDKTFWTEFKGKKYKEYNAREVFNLIVEGAWRNGEPGVLFQNRIDQSPYQEAGEEIFSTNPCSEQPLPPNGVCNLGSIDLSKLLNKNKQLDYEKLETIVKLAVKFLDSVIDKTTYPTKEIEEWSIANRPIGLGVMGYADYLLMKEITYGSKEALDELETIMSFIYNKAKEESENLGKIFGVPSMCQKLSEPRRNITILTVAPTGTISLIAGCSSGIEPVFSEIIVRNDKTGTYTFENDLAKKPYFKCAVSSNGTAHEVNWEEHIRTLASAQKYVDSGVSKTINFPQSAKRESMASAIILAWKLNCKGLAMYRDKSRKVQVLSPKNLKRDKCPICGNDLVTMNDKKRCLVCKQDDVATMSPTTYD